MERDNASNGANPSGPSPDTPWLEWVASGVGLMLALGMFGLIGWQALNDAGSPPVITVETIGMTSVTGGYRVMFRAHNIGGAVAAQVRIEGVLTQGNGPNETSDVVLDYIPGHSTREGGLFFTQDPQSRGLLLRAAGFAEP
jgi:uncharacterized protein (TIGR02588 family)